MDERRAEALDSIRFHVWSGHDDLLGTNETRIRVTETCAGCGKGSPTWLGFGVWPRSGISSG
jgi:hypothetical protein